MLNIQYETVNNVKCVKLHDRYYSLLEDVRGARPKFWIKRSEPKRVNYEEPNDENMILVKFNRNGVSCEDWGEIIASAVARKTEVPCVDYYSALIIEEDGSELGRGVACGSYKRSKNETEISGFNLQSMHKNLVYDNCRGRQVQGLNTVDGFIDAIQHVFDGKLNPNEVESVRNDLLKQAIFDFVLGQTDRHWLNTTFLVWKDKNENFHIRKAECYDNGCIAMAKRKAIAIEGMSKEIGSLGKDSPYLRTQLEKYCPMMGIKTSLVYIDDKSKSGNVERVRIVNPRENKKIFLKELANEIIQNPEIAVFYKLLESKISSGDLLSRVTKDLQASGDCPPDFMLKMVGDVMGHQVGELDRYVRRTLNEVNQKYEEEEMLNA